MSIRDEGMISPLTLMKKMLKIHGHMVLLRKIFAAQIPPKYVIFKINCGQMSDLQDHHGPLVF